MMINEHPILGVDLVWDGIRNSEWVVGDGEGALGEFSRRIFNLGHRSRFYALGQRGKIGARHETGMVS